MTLRGAIVDDEILRGLGGKLLRLAAHRLVAEFEPDKDSFRVRPGHVGAITKTLSRIDHDQVKSFRTPKGRDTFLWAARRHLDPIATHEELVVGFGMRRGPARSAAARIDFVYRAVGERTRVTVTEKLIALLETQLTKDRAEVILIHNHPVHPVHAVVRELVGDWKPLPSTSDRDIAMTLLASRVGHLLTSAWPSSFKFYLLDQGHMAEFLLPSPDPILDNLGVPR
jgi:hypothetical protein